mmetsp:Transcript_8695/g.12301  ORF Transcript_8695/g.12301 Transcript_8695/m.12301 type:complete len:81 (-) Transcript_8695:174-416(-)
MINTGIGRVETILCLMCLLKQTLFHQDMRVIVMYILCKKSYHKRDDFDYLTLSKKKLQNCSLSFIKHANKATVATTVFIT